nr:MAG TPA: hypothetical protein [Podoviridae sp. ctY3D12]
MAPNHPCLGGNQSVGLKNTNLVFYIYHVRD